MADVTAEWAPGGMNGAEGQEKGRAGWEQKGCHFVRVAGSWVG